MKFEIKKDYLVKIVCDGCDARSGKIVTLYKKRPMNTYDISRSFCKGCLEAGLKILGD